MRRKALWFGSGRAACGGLGRAEDTGALGSSCFLSQEGPFIPNSHCSIDREADLNPDTSPAKGSSEGRQSGPGALSSRSEDFPLPTCLVEAVVSCRKF